jgi:hypothetical protein
MVHIVTDHGCTDCVDAAHAAELLEALVGSDYMPKREGFKFAFRNGRWDVWSVDADAGFSMKSSGRTEDDAFVNMALHLEELSQ